MAPRLICPFCASEEVTLFFPNMPWFTLAHCHTCGGQWRPTEEQIDEELKRRNEADEAPTGDDYFDC